MIYLTMNNNMSQPLFDANITNTQATNNSAQQPANFEDALIAHREKWTEEITNLNNMMKSLPKVDELLTQIYAKRQECVDYYTSMNNVILNQNKAYKQRYNNMFNNVKINGFNGMRLNTDANISKCVEAELADQKNIIDILVNHNNYIKETISTIDNLIYGINQKIKLAEILNGIKF